MKKLLLWLTVVLVVISMVTTFSVVGCKAKAEEAAPEEEVAEEAAPEEEVAEEAAPEEEAITLEVWNHSGAIDPDTMDKLCEIFYEKYNIKINLTTRSFTDTMAVVMTALPDGAGGDINTVNNGEKMMGPLVRGGFLVPLDKYAEEYGWYDKLLSPSLFAFNRYSADGKVMGIGNLYGSSYLGELVGVFYNKAIFKKLGLDIPKTFADLEADLKTIKEAGITPIVLGGLDGWVLNHVRGQLQHALVDNDDTQGRNYLKKMVIEGSPDYSWVSESTIESAKVMQDWVKKGYFTEGFAGISYPDSVNMFAAGEGAMMLTGSWNSDTIAASDLQFGFFPFPPIDPAKTGPIALQIGGVTTPYGVNAATKHPDECAKFLDFLCCSKEATDEYRKASLLVATVPADLSDIPKDSLIYDLYDSWNKVNQADKVGYYIDFATPTFFDTIAAADQNLFALKITPEKLAQTLEADYKNWIETKNK